MKEVPIPPDLQGNDRDGRGLPIPFVVYRDVTGTPHFSVNDIGAVDEVIEKNLCGLCGKPLKPGQVWFAGGPGSAFLHDGMYIDPFMHEDCGRYAMQVCPFLAARSYSKRVEGRTLDAEHLHDDALVHDNKIAPPRPIFFALTCAAGFTALDANDGSGQKHILPDRPWKHVEFWENGTPITLARAAEIARAQGLPTDKLLYWPR